MNNCESFGLKLLNKSSRSSRLFAVRFRMRKASVSKTAASSHLSMAWSVLQKLLAMA
jgi:hypothetical protein